MSHGQWLLIWAIQRSELRALVDLFTASDLVLFLNDFAT
jgi:hypothetical protein